MVLDDTTGTSSRLEHCNDATHRSEFPMQRALAVDVDQPPLRPPPCSSPNVYPGLQIVLAPEIDRESERDRKALKL